MFSQAANRALLFSVRQDIINYFRKNLDPEMPVLVHTECNELNLDSFSLVFYDLSLLENKGRDFLNYVPYISDKTKFFFIISTTFPKELTNKLYSSTKNIIPYPCISKFFKNYVHKIFNERQIGTDFTKLQKDYFYDDEDNPIISQLLGKSDSMKEVKNKILYYSKTEDPILLLGESGTGKTTSARIIHELSSRNKYAFVPVNCATLAGNFEDSALFGTEDGAYTDAKTKMGHIKKAAGGTLFLDEIGIASVELQAKLYMFCDSKSIYSVGSDVLEKVDTRLIFATNYNLKNKILDGTFRKELYFRISANVITIPPLRERREDISFIAQALAEKEEKYISNSAMRKLEEYSWPGNVRQLENCIKRAIAVNMGDVIKENNIFFGI